MGLSGCTSCRIKFEQFGRIKTFYLLNYAIVGPEGFRKLNPTLLCFLPTLIFYDLFLFVCVCACVCLGRYIPCVWVMVETHGNRVVSPPNMGARIRTLVLASSKYS